VEFAVAPKLQRRYEPCISRLDELKERKIVNAANICLTADGAHGVTRPTAPLNQRTSAFISGSNSLRASARQAGLEFTAECGMPDANSSWHRFQIQ
jgi:hypothetical protein